MRIEKNSYNLPPKTNISSFCNEKKQKYFINELSTPGFYKSKLYKNNEPKIYEKRRTY